MPDRSDPGARSNARPVSDRVDSAATLIVALSGVMGAAGVGLSAAATHEGGGALASTAGLFLLLHAATGLALAALARVNPTQALGLLVSALLLLIGTIVFASDLALVGFAARRPFPAAAPIGGVSMIAGWIGVPVTVLLGRRSKGRDGLS